MPKAYTELETHSLYKNYRLRFRTLHLTRTYLLEDTMLFVEITPLKVLPHAPLHTRAWVLQERLLAKRVLHFGENELMWECVMLNASEPWASGIPGPVWTRPKSFFGRRGALGDERNYHSVHSGWCTIAEIYSSARVTYANDRAVAISGIAKRFERLLEDEYLVGNVEKVLAHRPMWQTADGDVDEIASPDCSPWKFRLPTFSRLSLESHMRMREIKDSSIEQIMADIVNTEIDYVSEDRTGLVRSGRLYLKRHLRRVQLLPSRTQATWVGESNGGPMGRALLFKDIGRPSLPTYTTGNEHFLLPILKASLSSTSPYVRGLILEVVDPWHFRRIGVFTIRGEAGIFQLMIKSGNEPSYPRIHFDEATGRHTACIV